MRYERMIHRPRSAADAYILQPTIGCSWNACTYCDMYRLMPFRVRDLGERLGDMQRSGERLGSRIEKAHEQRASARGWHGGCCRRWLERWSLPEDSTVPPLSWTAEKED